MVGFINGHPGVYGIEPICRAIPIVSSTCYAFKACETDPSSRAPRAELHEKLRPEIRRVWEESLEVYGAKKVGRQLNR